MRADISFNRTGWLYKLDHRKIILIAFLARFIFAAMYDSFVSVTGNESLVPDGKFYSVRGKYIALLLNGYDSKSFTRDMVPSDRRSQYIFQNAIETEGGRIPLRFTDESTVFTYIIGLIHFIFGYFPLGVRVFNIALSIGSTYLLFMIARRHFGDLVANLFLLIALFLPSQFVYSLTLTRDFIRMFVVSLTLWVIYGKKS
ncbi:MAG: glycosyltransferase family 39 protein [Candidatus Omnitrophota bacterium]